MEKNKEMEQELKKFSGVYEVTRYGYYTIEAHDYDEAQKVLEDAVDEGCLREYNLPNEETRIDILDELEDAKHEEADFSSEETVIHVKTKDEDKPEYVDYEPLSQNEWELYEQLRDRVLMKEIDEKIGFIAEEIELPTDDEEWPNMMRDVFIEYKEEDGGSTTPEMWDDRIDAIFSRVLEGYGYKRDWENDRWVKVD